MLDRKVPPSSKNAPRTRSLLATILKVAALGLLIAIAVPVVYAIYVGDLEGARAIATVQERLGKNIDVEIFSYRKGVGERYICGMAFPKGKPASDGKLFYVVEHGMFPHVTSAGIDGDKNFSDLYLFTCGSGKSGHN